MKKMFIFSILVFVIAMLTPVLGGTADVVELEFWLRDTRPSNVEAMQKIVANFEQANPGIKVNVVLTPWDSVEQKTMTAIAAGTLPDLSQLNQTGAADYGAKGVLLKLEDKVQTWDRKSEVAQISLSQAQYNGQYYAVPWFAGSNVMFYNKDLFVKAGIVDDKGEAKAPVTWDEFLEDAKKLTLDTDGDGSVDQWGFVVRGNVSLTIPVREFMLAAGDGDWIDTSAGNKVIINSPENLKGLEFYLDLYREHKVVPPDTPSVDYVAEEQYFLSGKVAMMFNGPWNLGNMYEAKINWGVALEPKSERHAAHIGGCPVGIFATTKHPEEAWKFATYLVSDEAQHIWAIEYGCGLPITKKAQEEAKTDPVLKVFVESLQFAERDGVTPPPQVPQWVTIERSIAPPIFQAGLLGELSAEDVLKQLEADIIALMNQ
ncbi:MAG: sugar ABC transporter substrate-binding protein [Candidatus Vecturithrix sp.]|jgi:multiple sugar transport system substrate-binding protein|nr:sugar ABC transporter substrate-binding protein [Candidatus Vecturithrix sp.]